MGMGIGSIAAGVLADRFGGVRWLFLLCVSWFSVGMMLCAAAPTAELLGIARFVAGFGLGGVVPTAVALTMSVAPAHRKNFLNGMILAGLPLGGVIAALTALAFLDVLSWRGVFFIGGAFPLLTVVPIVAVKLGRWYPRRLRCGRAVGGKHDGPCVTSLHVSAAAGGGPWQCSPP